MPRSPPHRSFMCISHTLLGGNELACESALASHPVPIAVQVPRVAGLPFPKGVSVGGSHCVAVLVVHV